MFTTTCVGNRAPYSTIGMRSSYKMLHETGPDLRLFRVIGAKDFVHIEINSNAFKLKALIRRLVRYSGNNESYRV